MNAQRRIAVTLMTCSALGLAIAGGWLWVASSAEDRPFEEALDDLEFAPPLAKGDREPRMVATRADRSDRIVTAGRSIGSDGAGPKPLPPLRGISVYRPVQIEPAPLITAYADPTQVTPPYGVPFQSLERQTLTEPPADEPSLEDDEGTDAAGVAPTPAVPGVLPHLRPTVVLPSDADMPVPRRRPEPPPGQETARVVPQAIPDRRPAVAVPQLETRVAALAPTRDEEPDKARGSSLFQRSQPGPSAFRTAVAPPQANPDDAPPGVRVDPQTPAPSGPRRPAGPQVAALSPPTSTDESKPSVILRTPFGVPYTLQTSSVEFSCAPPALLSLLRTFERRYGQKVVVTSGYRSRGRSGSMHRRCLAADIIVPGVPANDLAKFARTIPGMGGIGHYCHPNMIHIDVGTPREWKYGCGSYFVARDGTGSSWGRVPTAAQVD